MKRTASATAIRGAEQSASVPIQPNATEAQPIAAAPVSAVTPVASAAGAKVVVGRQALKQLAETATVPPPHAAFTYERAPAHNRVEARPGPNTVAAVVSAPLVSEPKRHVSDHAPAAARAPEPAIESHPESRQPQLRLDPAIAAAAGPPVAGLEVDCLAWPPACDALIDRVRTDLEAVAAQLTRQAAGCGVAIAVLSIDEGHGGTTVALCLARILAQQETRVCLVDGDYRQPGLAESLGLDPESGLESVLAGSAPLCEVLVESLEDQLMLLPLARPLATDAVERSKLRQTATFGELRDQFDLVLVDAGSLGAAPALRPTMLGAGVIDSVILVGRQTADLATWQRARQSLAQWNVPCLGAIANRCAA
jgi:Mrp family chromosome partitioning ATPase